MYQQTSACRLCGNTELFEVLDLGVQADNDVFPKARTQRVAAAPLKLVKCTGDDAVCGLLQLAHTYVTGDSYGPTTRHFNLARGGSSVRQNAHLQNVLDQLLPEHAAMAKAGATDSIQCIEPRVEFLCEATMRSSRQNRSLVRTSLSRLSSQERPLEFLAQVREALDSHGVCIIQECYMPYMLRRNAYDSICHQQLAYYALKQIRWMAQKVGLKIIGIELNPAGTGTAIISLARRESPYEVSAAVESILDEEAREGLHTWHPYDCFAKRVIAGLTVLRAFLDRARDAGKSVCALGAARSGNVILQCCHATETDIEKVGEIDSAKVGAFTPGTLLPIVLEEDVLELRPRFLLVLPWHLRGTFLRKPRLAGCDLLFPLPRLEVVRAGTDSLSA
jgi:NDP-4-keto-2,6-dideoxyhexose 3-C-methyltransferase